MIKTLPISQVRANLATLVDKARKRLDEYVITVNGVPAAVLMSHDEYESWKETNEILANPELMKAIKEGEEEMEKGNYVMVEDLEKELKD